MSTENFRGCKGRPTGQVAVVNMFYMVLAAWGTALLTESVARIYELGQFTGKSVSQGPLCKVARQQHWACAGEHRQPAGADAQESPQPKLGVASAS